MGNLGQYTPLGMTYKSATKCYFTNRFWVLNTALNNKININYKVNDLFEKYSIYFYRFKKIYILLRVRT